MWRKHETIKVARTILLVLMIVNSFVCPPIWAMIVLVGWGLILILVLWDDQLQKFSNQKRIEKETRLIRRLVAGQERELEKQARKTKQLDRALQEAQNLLGAAVELIGDKKRLMRLAETKPQ